MKNKLFILALLVLFVSVLFTSCGGDNPKMVKEVKVSTVTGGYILSWEAVGKNVADYEVFAKQKDKASANHVAGATNKTAYSGFAENYGYLYPTGPVNSDLDKWYAGVSKINDLPAGDYYFGVRTFSTEDHYSNIKWTKDTYPLTK
jgi:hypothetical protein